MVIQLANSLQEYAMAMVKYNEKIYAIPWEEARKICKFNEEQLRRITYCVYKQYITFVFICEENSYVVVYNAELGEFAFSNECRFAVKAICLGEKVFAVIKLPDGNGIVDLYVCKCDTSNNNWKYEDLGVKKKERENDEDDYKIIAAKDNIIVKINNSVNDVEYINYIEKKYSIYCLYDYWKDKDVGASEGTLDKNSMFLEFLDGNSNIYRKITFCDDPKFAAGYLKYIVLGDVAYMLMIDDDEVNELLFKDDNELENDYIPDIEHIIDLCRNTKDKYSPVSLLESVVELCDVIFIETDREKAIKLLKEVCILFNRYFEEYISSKTNYRYVVNVYNGAKDMEDILLNKSTSIKDEAEIRQLLKKDVWDEADKLMFRTLLDTI